MKSSPKRNPSADSSSVASNVNSGVSDAAGIAADQVDIELGGCIRSESLAANNRAAMVMFTPNLSTHASTGADIPTVVDGADRKYTPAASAIHGSAFGPSRPASSKYDSSKSKPTTYELIKNPMETARRRIGLFEFSGPRTKNQAIDEKSAQLLSKYLAGYDRVIGSAYR